MKRNSKTEKIIKLFIDEVKHKIPAITKIIYEYDSANDTYCIWHNLIPNEEQKYEKEIGTLIYDYLYKKGIYNVGFGYSSEKF